MSPPDLLDVLRSHDAAAPALVLLDGLDERFRWTYQQLLQAAAGFRRALEAGGVGQGASVCLISGNSPQFVALFLACLDLGAAFVPVHPDQSAATMVQILRELRPALVIIDEDLQGSLLRKVMREGGTAWRLRTLRTPWLRPVLAGNAHRQKAAPAGEAASYGNGDAAPVLVLHSSGSTGAPKVIQYSRERLNVFLHWQRLLFDAFPDVASSSPSARVNALPMAHFGGLSFVLQALIDGRCVFLPRAIAPYDYLQLAIRTGCQLLMLVPALYDALLADSRGALPLSALRYCLTMGEAVPPQLIARITQALGVRLFSAYGMSECLSGLSHHGEDTPPNSCGRILFGEARLVEGDEPGCAAGEGELWVRNETTFPCYRDPALNAAKFSGAWYRTGDRFRRDALGHHYFLGRVDAMGVVNGRNVYPADIERVLLQHPDVTDCMAAPVTLEQGRRRFGVLVCLAIGSRETAAGLVDWFLEHGALHATPALLALGKGIPRNAAGKRDRLAVAELLQHDYRQCLRKVS